MTHPLSGARAAAKLAGAITYQSHTCKTCGGTERYTSSMDCVECARARKRRYRQVAKLPAIERMRLRKPRPSNAGQARDYAPPRRGLHPIVEVLRKARYERGMSQDVLAERMGYSGASIQDWESGRRRPSIASVYDWAQALGLRLEVRGE